MTTHHTTSSQPLELLKAHAQLQQRIVALLQENGQRQWSAAQQTGQQSLEHASAAASQLLQAGNWQTLSALPAESFWQVLQQQWADAQAAGELHSQNQQALMAGLQQAVQQWQAATSQVLSAQNPNAWMSAWAGGAPTVEWLKQCSSLWGVPAAWPAGKAASNVSKNKA